MLGVLSSSLYAKYAMEVITIISKAYDKGTKQYVVHLFEIRESCITKY